MDDETSMIVYTLINLPTKKSLICVKNGVYGPDKSEYTVTIYFCPPAQSSWSPLRRVKPLNRRGSGAWRGM